MSLSVGRARGRSRNRPRRVSQRTVRIAKLRVYVKENFDDILQTAEEDIGRKGWIPADNEDIKADTINQPCLVHMNIHYRRPWGDFLLTLAQRAREWYHVTEKTALSYARVALRDFERKLSAKKWRRPANGAESPLRAE